MIRRIIRRKTSIFAILGTIPLLMLSVPPAKACPDGQYNQCLGFLCGCVPNGGTISKAINPVPDILTTANGVLHGNVHLITQGVGALVIGASCPTCALAGQTILDHQNQVFVETVVGRGWLVFLVTGSPSIVLVDTATSIVTDYTISHPKDNPLQPPRPVRSAKTYKASDALCAIRSDDGSVLAGWVDEPVLTDAAGSSYTFPHVDLAKGDLVKIHAVNKAADCAAPLPGNRFISDFTMSWQGSQNYPVLLPTEMSETFTGVVTGEKPFKGHPVAPQKNK